MIVDFTNVLEENVGKFGIRKDEIVNNSDFLFRIKENVIRKELSSYYPLVLVDTMQKSLQEINEYAKSVREQFDNLVVVGMGGSVVGNELLHFGLSNIYTNLENTKKIFFIDNIDADTNLTLLSNLDLKKTFFNFITKSGSTSETLLNLLLIFDFLKQRNLDIKKHVLFTTDPEKGFLRTLAKEFDIKAFPIDPLVGGRYSVLSSVGLFSTAFEGFDIEKLLYGAKKKKEHFETSDVLEEAALILPFVQYKLFKEHNVNINLLFSYSDSLEYLGKWYEQLVAESIGKKFSKEGDVVNVGITPVVARGAYHQHSTLQLFIEGPYDKLVIFVFPEEKNKDYKIKGSEFIQKEDVEFLLNKNYSELLKQEYYATKAALTEAGKPNLSIEVSTIDEESLGELLYFFELEVLSLGEMLNINPVDQPGVELGKKFTHALMNDKKYSEYLSQLEKYKNFKKFVL